jgi:aminoglycoside/choline kinase family phosphotransferase
MLTEDGLAVIDFQDAIVGSNTYDLCSLLKDAYLELSANDLQTLLNYSLVSGIMRSPLPADKIIAFIRCP